MARQQFAPSVAPPDLVDAGGGEGLSFAGACEALGVAPGDTLTFFVAGYADLQPTAPSPVRSRDVVGVFATSGALGAPDAPARVAGGETVFPAAAPLQIGRESRYIFSAGRRTGYGDKRPPQ